MIPRAGRSSTCRAWSRRIRQGGRAQFTSSATEVEANKSRLGVCVVGGGRMGVIRGQGAHASLESTLCAMVDSDADNAAKLRQKFGVPVHSSLQEALQDKRVGGVWIATPTPEHNHLIRAAAEAGKAVGVEKPVAARVEDIKECYSMCQSNGVPLFCSFQRRVDPSFVAMCKAVHGGAVGGARSMHAVFRDHPVPPLKFLLMGGDIFHDLAVHDIDYARWLLKEDPCQVFASATSFVPELRDAGVADSAHVMLTFPSGVVFTLEMTRCSAYGYDNRMEVAGETGMLEVVNKPRTDLISSNSQGVSRPRPDHSFPERYAYAFAEEMSLFARVASGAMAPLVTCEDSWKATHIAEMASQSAKAGRPLTITY